MRQMVALILAARANERLEEQELALEAAQEAHEVMQHHWFAKLEVGRQHALSGQHSKAFERAEEAFWLRAQSIRQIDRDDAYRGLGRDFDKFRDDLDAKVRLERKQSSRWSSPPWITRANCTRKMLDSYPATLSLTCRIESLCLR